MATAAENRRYRARIRQLVDDYKASFGGCVDCHRDDLPLEIYHLDHVQGTKEFQPSSCSQFGEARVRAELAKCELRCPTCHALRHWQSSH